MRTTEHDAASVGAVMLSSAGAVDREVAGGKAGVLARLMQAGFPVPEGFVLPPATVAALSGGDDPDARDAVAAALRSLPDREVAVRSSAVGEDGEEASYAGQYETVLGVRGLDAVVEAVAVCAASSAGDRVAAYRRTGGLGRTPVAVLIQPMIPADAAGVAFTADPVTGDRVTLVSAVRGLGDRLVGGEANPDEWVVANGTPQPRTIVEDAVDAVAVARVADLAARVEDALDTPIDIEWALADGQLHLLQARPITALPVEPDVEVPPGPWTKDAAHFTGPVVPLTATAMLPLQDDAIRSMCANYGLLPDNVVSRALGWEVYVQTVPPGGGSADGKPPPAPLLGVALRLAPLLRRKARAAAEALAAGRPERSLSRWWREWRPSLEAEADRLASRDLAALPGEELATHVEDVLAHLRWGLELHFELFVPYIMAIHDLVSLCDELLGWDRSRALELVDGLSTASSEPVRELASLAARLRADPAASEVVASWDGTDATGLLARLEEAAPDGAAALDAYRRRFGVRLLSYDVGDRTLGEDPRLLLSLLRDQRSEPAGAADDAATVRREAATQAAREAIAGLDGREGGHRFEAALERAQTAWPVREDNLVHTASVPLGLLRLAALEVGRRLAMTGHLRRAEDGVWCTLDELWAAIGGDPAADLADRVGRRRSEHAWVRAHPGPFVRGCEPSPPPDVRFAPPAVRRTTGALLWAMGEEFATDQPQAADTVVGVGASPGRYTGPVRVVGGEDELDRVRPGDVLVCPITTPQWSVVFGVIGAVVADGGGLLAHAAVVARENGVPAVLGTGDATTRLTDGQQVTVDGTTGVVQTGGRQQART